jgi:hypothetical protein
MVEESEDESLIFLKTDAAAGNPVAACCWDVPEVYSVIPLFIPPMKKRYPSAGFTQSLALSAALSVSSFE